MKHSKHEEASWAELSEDVLHQILLRVPLKSLGKCKLVSILWHTLISNPEFAKSHVLQFSNRNGNGDEPFLFLALQIYNTIALVKVNIMNTKGGDECRLIPLDQQFEPHGYGYGYGGYYFLVGSCHGMVCLYFKKKGKLEDLVYVWNPIINKHKQISLPQEQWLTYLLTESCWFGFVPSLKTYKIFLVYNVCCPAFVERKYVYSSQWREILETEEVGGVRNKICVSGAKAIVINEALHYLIDGEFIQKFDLVSETFERIPLSISRDLLPSSFQMFLGALGGNKSLCAMVLHNSEPELMFDLWVLEEYNKWESLQKRYKINMEMRIARDCARFLGFTNNGYFCVEGKEGLKFIDQSYNPPLYVNVKRCALLVHEVTNHVESLVSPLLI